MQLRTLLSCAAALVLHSGCLGALHLAGGFRGGGGGGGGGGDDDAEPEPPRQAPSHHGWYRFGLATGHIVDGQLVGGDRASYFVQTPYGLYSILHVHVVSLTALGVPGPLPAPR